jgi:hypothetical protein
MDDKIPGRGGDTGGDNAPASTPQDVLVGRACLVLAHPPQEPVAVHSDRAIQTNGGCETCSAAVEDARLSASKSMEVPQRYQERQIFFRVLSLTD